MHGSLASGRHKQPDMCYLPAPAMHDFSIRYLLYVYLEKYVATLNLCEL